MSELAVENPGFQNNTRGLSNETKALNHTATYDGDGIVDGQEYDGYNVTMVLVVMNEIE